MPEGKAAVMRSVSRDSARDGGDESGDGCFELGAPRE